MKMYGKQYTRNQLRQRVGHMDQVAGVHLVQREDGRARPTRAAEFHTGSGLAFTALPDRCLDISWAAFRGKAMGWRGTPGDVAPQYYDAGGLEWLHSYFGGLLTTCGLTNVGSPDPDPAGTNRGQHGRIGNTPAEDLAVQQAWEGNDFVMRVSGTMREAVTFGDNLSLRRSICTKLGENRFWLSDVLTNEGFKKSPVMILYHCNVGWPALDAGSRMLAPSRHAAPRDDDARDGAAQWDRMHAPKAGYAEKVYYHDMVPSRDGSVVAAIVNDGFTGKGEGFGVYVKYNKHQLPRFVQWKMLGAQDYVVGLEPCTCGVEGRKIDEELGLLEYLRPGEHRQFDLEFGVITTRAEYDALRQRCRRLETELVESYRSFVKKP